MELRYFDWHQRPPYHLDYAGLFPRDAKLLDLGCGIGWMSEHYPDYHGIDGSEAAVDHACRLGRNVAVGDLERPLPFEDASFQAVCLKDILEHLANPMGLVREVHRVLRPGGRAFASSPDAQRWVWDDYTHRRPFTKKAFRQLFADQGFSVDRVAYECVHPGTGHLSRILGLQRRLPGLNFLAGSGLLRRNVTVLATKTAPGESH